MKIGKTYSFESAHHLPNHRGKCKNPHGHSYRLEVEIEGGLIHNPDASDDLMVEDFSSLDQVVNPLIEILDHVDLNKIEGLSRTTAEGILLYIVGTLKHTMEIDPGIFGKQRPRIWGGDPKLSRVRLYETEKAYAEWP